MNHTSGPWEIAYFPKDIAIITRAPVFHPIVATVHDRIGSLEETYPNARLISAAPELLQACKDLVSAFEYYGNGGVDQDTVEEVKAAIAKAEEA